MWLELHQRAVFVLAYRMCGCENSRDGIMSYKAFDVLLVKPLNQMVVCLPSHRWKCGFVEVTYTQATISNEDFLTTFDHLFWQEKKSNRRLTRA